MWFLLNLNNAHFCESVYWHCNTFLAPTHVCVCSPEVHLADVIDTVSVCRVEIVQHTHNYCN